jgi:pyridoxal 5'-phosphate synthase pdxT subunit
VSAPRIGVLALQGAFREHVALLRELGAEAYEVRTPAELQGSDALVLPGGESTAIGMLLDSSGLSDPLAAFDGPMLGTCAGMIVLAREAVDGRSDQRLLGRIDIAVRRNGWGRQVRSFEAPLDLAGDPQPFPGVFIRAPRIERLGEGVEVVARLGDEPVAVSAGRIMVAAFHPELAGDARLHDRFLRLVREDAQIAA